MEHPRPPRLTPQHAPRRKDEPLACVAMLLGRSLAEVQVRVGDEVPSSGRVSMTRLREWTRPGVLAPVGYLWGPKTWGWPSGRHTPCLLRVPGGPGGGRWLVYSDGLVLDPRDGSVRPLPDVKSGLPGLVRASAWHVELFPRAVRP